MRHGYKGASESAFAEVIQEFIDKKGKNIQATCLMLFISLTEYVDLVFLSKIDFITIADNYERSLY